MTSLVMQGNAIISLCIHVHVHVDGKAVKLKTTQMAIKLALKSHTKRGNKHLMQSRVIFIPTSSNYLGLQSNQVKRTPQDCINELTI